MTRGVISILFGVALLTALIQFPRRIEPFVRLVLPVVSIWGDPDAQYRQQLEHVPYDMLRTAEAQLARDAPNRRRRRLGGAPRRIHHVSPRHLFPRAPSGLVAVAGAPGRHVGVAAVDFRPAHAGGGRRRSGVKGRHLCSGRRHSSQTPLRRLVADWGTGYLLQLHDDRPCLSGAMAGMTRAAGAGWPLQLVGAPLVIVAIGDLLLTRIGHRARGRKWLALS